ncbi:MAG: aldehyde dehydrogenase family protein [Cytophagales bacterium]|nr:aldehyde dehydrogenase family protein [Cytophagales bacterium]
MKIINPATEEIIAAIEEDNGQIIKEKYEVVREGQQLWQVPIIERISIIRKFYDLLKNELEQLAMVLTDEMGKPLDQSQNEIKGARARIKFFLENSEKWLREEQIVNESGIEEKIAWEPLGIIANISAWNYPYLVGVNVFIPALIAGNGVLYKPSEYTTLTGLKIEELLHKAGVPQNVFQTITGGKDAGEALLKLPLDGYFFTGSYKTGLHIYETVAHRMVPCQLELGGKDPLYVTDDNKNMVAVAKAATEGTFCNNGQSCCAVERIYVHQDVYDDFTREFVKEVKQLKAGNPDEIDVFIGPVTRQEQLKFLQRQVDDALQKGANLLTGGKKMERKGYYFQPTILVNVNHKMSVMKDESFGPVIGICKVKDDEEAVALMQDTEFGLTAAVYSDSRQRAEKILQKINTGTVYWNCCDRVSANLPWSGRKHSGIGTTLSYMGIRAFVQPKAYHFKHF